MHEIMQGDPYHSSHEEWATCFHHPQLNTIDHLVGGTHIDEHVDMVGQMNNALIVMVDQVTKDVHNVLMLGVVQDGVHAWVIYQRFKMISMQPQNHMMFKEGHYLGLTLMAMNM